jgi:NACHT domain
MLTQRAARGSERREHVLPRARGLNKAGDGEDLWLFTGRHHALADVCAWLRTPGGRATLVVTGDPGSGKSALLARLFLLAGDRRGQIPQTHTLPANTIPPPGSVTEFIHARGKTSDQLLEALCVACRIHDIDTITRPGELLAQVHAAGKPVTVIVDAVDEAIGHTADQAKGHFPPVDQVLAPLVAGAARTPLRLLLGTRRHLLPTLGHDMGHDMRLVDLDKDRYADPDSVRSYVHSCLVELSESSPYRRQAQRYLDAVADAVADAAGGSFLVAFITARSLALRPDLVNPYDPVWRASLPRPPPTPCETTSSSGWAPTLAALVTCCFHSPMPRAPACRGRTCGPPSPER